MKFYLGQNFNLDPHNYFSISTTFSMSIERSQRVRLNAVKPIKIFEQEVGQIQDLNFF